MSNPDHEEGWRQVSAGVGLILWSRLAYWQEDTLTFCAADEATFESKDGHSTLHKKFGRLICWLAFGVGGEYLAKGTCLLNDLPIGLPAKRLIRPPRSDDDITKWVNLVLENDDHAFEKEPQFKTLSNLPVAELFPPGYSRDFVSVCIRLLAARMRNRDAHRYTENVRAFQFYTVPNLFVPTFNMMLGRLDQQELGHRLSSGSKTIEPYPSGESPKSPRSKVDPAILLMVAGKKKPE